jgi:phosphoserine aminotransferase
LGRGFHPSWSISVNNNKKNTIPVIEIIGMQAVFSWVLIHSGVSEASKNELLKYSNLLVTQIQM